MTIHSSADLDALLDFNAPAATEARLRALLPDVLPALRPEVLTQIAHALLSPDPWLAAEEPARLARLNELATPNS